jgi:hypothetical protein
MKVTNWCKKLRIALLAGGIWVPSMAYAIDIPLGDPSFEVFAVPGTYPATGDGYAYSDLYRPTSAWIDDLDSPSGYTQDDGVSNWLYEPEYGNDGPPFRAAARTGRQAMHGLANYNAQESTAVFEAKKTYRFSIWAQGDSDANATTSGVFMYIFDGDVAFSDANALKSELFEAGQGDFNNRGSLNAAQSKTNWKRISITHYVEPGAPEIGNPVGVGFFLRRDAAVDDAKLQVAPLLHLEVNTVSGAVKIKNQSGETVNVDYYEINSANSSLNATAWNSLEEQNLPGFPAGNGSGNGWEEFGGVTSKVIGESNPSGHSGVVSHPTNGVGLGDAFRLGFPHDLVFHYGVLLDEIVLNGDFNGDKVVNAADFVAWRKLDGTPEGYQSWVEEFGRTGGLGGASTLVRGDVIYVTSGGGGGVPEPTTVLLVGIGLATFAFPARRRSTEI